MAKSPKAATAAKAAGFNEDRLAGVSLSESRDMLYEKFRRNLRILRAGVGMSGVALSDSLGFKSGKRVIELEYGRTNPTIEEIMGISKYFDVQMDHLLHKSVKVIFE